MFSGDKNLFKKNLRRRKKQKRPRKGFWAQEIQKTIFYSRNHRFVLPHTQGLQLRLCQATVKWKARRKTLFLTQEGQECQYGDQSSHLTESPRVGAGRGLGSHFPPIHPIEEETEAHRGQVICSSSSCRLVPGIAPRPLVSSSLSTAPKALEEICTRTTSRPGCKSHFANVHNRKLFCYSRVYPPLRKGDPEEPPWPLGSRLQISRDYTESENQPKPVSKIWTPKFDIGLGNGAHFLFTLFFFFFTHYLPHTQPQTLLHILPTCLWQLATCAVTMRAVVANSACQWDDTVFGIPCLT